MKGLASIVGFLIFILIAVLAVSLSSEGSLSELQKLKADNFKLKSQLLQCQVNIGNTALTNEQRQLEIEFRSALGEKDETKVFDWTSLSFISKSTEVK